MIFGRSKDLAGQTRICIVDMGLVGARGSGQTGKNEKSHFKETPKASATTLEEPEEGCEDDLTFEVSGDSKICKMPAKITIA